MYANYIQASLTFRDTELNFHSKIITFIAPSVMIESKSSSSFFVFISCSRSLKDWSLLTGKGGGGYKMGESWV